MRTPSARRCTGTGKNLVLRSTTQTSRITLPGESEFGSCFHCQRFCVPESEQTQKAENVIDTELFTCKQEMQAAFSRHTPHLLRIKFVRWDYALITILPRALGTEVFLRGRSDLNIGAKSVTLVGPSARCQQRQNLAFTQRTTRSLHPSREKERNTFSGCVNFDSCLGKYV